MTTQKKFHAVADDTALVANISEIKRWIAKGDLTLTIPVYTLDRLHILKRDTSQIGINAREALKFLDRVTSGKDDLPESGIQLQGPDDQFLTWEEVEASIDGHRDTVKTQHDATDRIKGRHPADGGESQLAENATATPPSASALSQMLLNKLNFSKEPEVASNASTPPTSPSSSNLPSTKTSPEVLNSRPVIPGGQKSVNTDNVIVPHGYRPLINSAVFMLKPRMGESSTKLDSFMLSNDSDLAAIARNFGLVVKNIHQLRSSISSETQELRNQSKYQQKHSPKPSLSCPEPKEKTLFSYENEDEDDEVVFRPRPSRGTENSRGRSTANKLTNGNRRSAEMSVVRPPIPTDEIDPDSFDRGAFARARPSTPNNGPNETKEQTWQASRGGSRVGSAFSPGRGAGRGSSRGLGRGSARGKGKLFVP